MIKKLVSKSLALTGYKIVKIPTLQLEIKAGKYKWLQEFGINSVIDIGANTGQFCSIITQVLPNCEVYCFEPLQPCFDELKVKFLNNKNVKCFNFAIGLNQEQCEMNFNEFSPSSSILEMGKLHKDLFPHTSKAMTQIVNVRTLDSFQEELILKKRVLLKIDVQGFELNVLKGGDSILEMVDIIIIESSFVELYKNQPLFNDIYEYLSRKKFEYNGRFDQILSPLNGMNIQEDSIYIKKNR